MKRKGNSVVALERDYDKELVVFTTDMAERLLRMRNSGYTLPENSVYTYNDKDGIKLRANKADS